MSTAQCSAIANALSAKGLSYSQLASQVRLSEQRVTSILTGQAKATPQEFGAISNALGLNASPTHAAKVTTV